MENGEKDKLNLTPLKPFLKQDERLHELPVPIIALTGGIATGKSTVAKEMESRGACIIDADQLVKKIYSQKDTTEFIARLIPEVIYQEKIDFKLLREAFFKDPKLQKSIEQFIYSRMKNQFLQQYDELGRPNWVIYDVPLLFEKNLSFLVDLIILIYAPEEVQRERIKKRDHTSDEIIDKVLKSQWPIDQKKNFSNIVIDNSKDQFHLKSEIDRVWKQIIKGDPNDSENP